MIKGWKIIFKSLLALLKYSEEEIMNKKEEGEILNYVIQNLRKSNIFLDENFEMFLKIYNNFDVNNNIINDLRKNIIWKMRLKKN
jgi:hypothetical protein